MVQEWLAKGVFLYLMAGVCGIGILLKLMLISYYGKQLRQTLKMEGARKKWLVRMQQDFEECIDMHGKVNNVDIFVDKYVEGKKFMGIMLSTWDKIGGQVWILCAGLLVMAAVSGIFYQVDREAILFTFFIGIWTVIVDIVVDNIANLAEKRNQLKRNLKDYFNNHAWEGSRMSAQESGEEEDFSTEEAYWEEGAFAREDDYEQNTAFARENNDGGEEDAQGAETEEDGFAGAIRIRHLIKAENAPAQNVDFEEWKRKTGNAEKQGQAEAAPKFYVVSGAEKGLAQEAKPTETQTKEPDGISGETASKRMRKESKKEMAARKKREHMKYELKREMTEKETEPEEALAQAELQQEKKAFPREAMEQLAAALDLLKKENSLEDAAPLLAAQISSDQENGALIEEVLREFLV